MPSDNVLFEPVKSLVKMHENTELKLAPSLKSEHVNPGQYEKMRVNLAAQVVSHTTSSALKFCVEKQILPPAALTTAWV